MMALVVDHVSLSLRVRASVSVAHGLTIPPQLLTRAAVWATRCVEKHKHIFEPL